MVLILFPPNFIILQPEGSSSLPWLVKSKAGRCVCCLRMQAARPAQYSVSLQVQHIVSD